MTEIRIEGLRTRTLIFAACLALAFVGLVGRLAYLQVWMHDEYARLAEPSITSRPATRPMQRLRRTPIV
jgi:cell division protein FtsI/penicillin-binding protein 2